MRQLDLFPEQFDLSEGAKQHATDLHYHLTKRWMLGSTLSQYEADMYHALTQHLTNTEQPNETA